MKKTIMVDLDRVITNGGFLYLINDYLKTSYTEDDMDNYYMQEIVDDKDDFFKYFISKNQYDYCKLIPSAKEVLKYLTKHFDVYICSSYVIMEIPRECGKILTDKHNYLYDNLPFISPEKYIFMKNKSLLNCDIKIDDKLENLKNASIKLLFSAYHNKNLTDEYLKSLGVIRVNSWLEIKDILKKEVNCEGSSSKK